MLVQVSTDNLVPYQSGAKENGTLHAVFQSEA
jgi:hypothetical protein